MASDAYSERFEKPFWVKSRLNESFVTCHSYDLPPVQVRSAAGRTAKGFLLQYVFCFFLMDIWKFTTALGKSRSALYLKQNR